MRITFLGTGTSHGVPVIGCPCPVCTSKDPRDRRTRASVMVEQDHFRLLIDATPELRVQLLAQSIPHIDAMLLTHAHADHIGGLDDVRIFSERTGQAFPIYGPRSGLQLLKRRFDYAFRPTQVGGGKPRLSLHPVTRKFMVGPLQVTPIPLWHGRLRVFGYRIGPFAYCTDVSRIPPGSYRLLAGLEVLVLDALRHEPHETHFNVPQALAEARRIGARRTYFTHLCHRLGHRGTERALPPGVQLAYDGLRISG